MTPPMRASRTAAETQGPGQALTDWLTECGYTDLRQLPTGELAGVMRYLFTGGLVVGLTAGSYRTRYCYPTLEEAKQALALWDGQGDPEGGWIKRKGDAEYLNPAFVA